MDNQSMSITLLYRSKGLLQHVGVPRPNGMVLHNSPDNGVELVTYETFAKGQPVKTRTISGPTETDLAVRLRQILNSNGNYNVTASNCEHLVSYLVSGSAHSPQLQGVFLGAAAGGLASISSNSSKFMLHAVLGGIAGLVIVNACREYDGVIPAK